MTNVRLRHISGNLTSLLIVKKTLTQTEARTRQQTVERNSLMWLPEQEYDLVQDVTSTELGSLFSFRNLEDIDTPGSTKRDQRRQPNYRVGD